jgi:anoctamin-8
MPIHDQKDLMELREQWVFSMFSHQPLNKVCNYFGVKLALYFAWLGFYTKALVVPAFLGLAMWLSTGKSEVIIFILLKSWAPFHTTVVII